MKSIIFLIVSVLCSVLVVSCSQKPVAVPVSSKSSVSSAAVQITERTLENSPAESQTVASKVGPQPLSKPVVMDQADRSGDLADGTNSLPLGFVNGRIIEYEQKLVRWQELDNQSTVVNIGDEQTETMIRCYRELQRVLTGYQRLHDEQLRTNPAASNRGRSEIMDTLRIDVIFIEGTCGRLLGGGEGTMSGWRQGQGTMELEQIEVLIDQSAIAGDYAEVVNLWDQIPVYQVDEVDPITRIHFANALMFQDQPEKAAEIYQEIVDEIAFSEKQPMDILSLRRKLADLYTAGGNYLAAEGQYSKISTEYLAIGQIEEWSNQQLLLLERSLTENPELDDYSVLLRGYLGFLPVRDGYKIVLQAESFLQKYPYSPVSTNVDIIKADATSRADLWFNTFLSQVDTYISEKKYPEAMALIQTVSEDIIGEENFQKVKEKEGAIVLAEAIERESLKREQLQELQRLWNEGTRLADQDDIDGALMVFSELLETEYGSKAEMKIDELSLAAAKSERRKAADFFVRFTKAADVLTKKEMLVESRRILKDILRKYPDVDIAEKVAGNIRRVEKEMNELDPLLLMAIEQEEREKALLDKQELDQQPPEEEVDIFDMPLSQVPAPSAIKNSEPLPVILPADLQ